VGRLVRHAPVVQVCEAEQALPQVPQLAGSVWRSAQALAHIVWPAGHIVAPVHAPAAQVWPAAQVRLHMPQLAASVAVVTQTEPQRTWPVGQVMARQVPA